MQHSIDISNKTFSKHNKEQKNRTAGTQVRREQHQYQVRLIQKTWIVAKKIQS